LDLQFITDDSGIVVIVREALAPGGTPLLQRWKMVTIWRHHLQCQVVERQSYIHIAVSKVSSSAKSLFLVAIVLSENSSWAELIVISIAEVHNLLVKKFKMFPKLLQLREAGKTDEEYALHYVKACTKQQELIKPDMQVQQEV
jgi:hypothetical protein